MNTRTHEHMNLPEDGEDDEEDAIEDEEAEVIAAEKYSRRFLTHGMNTHENTTEATHSKTK
jgi:hypothetical protein